MYSINNYNSINYSQLQEKEAEIQGTDGVLTIYAYKSRDFGYRLFFHLSCVLCLGIPYVILNSYPWLKAILMYKSCALNICSVVLIRDANNEYELQKVTTELFTLPERKTERVLKYFHHKLVKYVDHDDGEGFDRVDGISRSSIDQLVENFNGYTESEQKEMLKYYGKNLISVNVKSYWKLLVEEIFNPFYLFQIFSIVLWSLDEYYYYAVCVLFLSAISVGTALYTTKKQSIALRDLVAASNASFVTVCRSDGNNEEINAENLVPGDIICIPSNGCVMTCDALLLAGNCIVNESMLTGESVPVTKTPPGQSTDLYRPSIHKRHTLYCGTEVLQTRYYKENQVRAIVVRTGFSTAKGELVRSIMFPKPMGFKFYADTVKFVLTLYLVAALGMTYCILMFLKRGVPLKMLVFRTLDIVTIVVPPALPVAMTAGPYYAQKRLKKNHSIFCISPASINVSGKIKLVCFDKTGTLTEEGLNTYGVVPCYNSLFGEMVREVPKLPVKSQLLAALATCHSLTMLNGKLQGDPLDLNMFESTEWDIEEPGIEMNKYDVLVPTVVRPKTSHQPSSSNEDLPYEIGIIRQFPFTSDEACMSVIGRTLDSSTMALYTKGAPERVVRMCRTETVPINFAQVLRDYTTLGLRVIALAWKELDKDLTWRLAMRAKRKELEHSMEFMGLLVMQNQLKPQTTPIIKKLQDANIRTVMITGDNILTAISVARECGMVSPLEEVVELRVVGSDDNSKITLHPVNTPAQIQFNSQNDAHEQLHVDITSFHYAVDGSTWSSITKYHPDVVPELVAKGTIFARMGPDQKTQLVKELQSIDYIVAMCGDGANDCGALKAAHIGISLSEAEASVAAPFTSTIPDISCVLSLILEGRCSLTTSFTVFKYMAMYSIIQFISVLILYTKSSTLGNMQFLYIDLVITTSLALFMGLTGPASKLTKQRPPGSLASILNVLMLTLQVTVFAGVQFGALYFLMMQQWYSPVNTTGTLTISQTGLEKKPVLEVVACWENTVIFTIGCFQYLIAALVYSKGKPYRKPLYTNAPLLLTIITIAAFNLVLMLYPGRFFSEFFELVPMSDEPEKFVFRTYLSLFPLVNLIVATIIEYSCADKKWLKRLIHWVVRKKYPKSKFKRILSHPTHWSSIQRIGSDLPHV